MKLNRWIYLPLIFILVYALPEVLFPGSFDKEGLLFTAILGAIVGFVTLWWADAKARKVTDTNDKEIYKVRQHRKITLLLNFEKAFEVCREAVKEINPAKIKEDNLIAGIIKFRTRWKWDDYGDVITIKLKKINETLTEVETSTRPIPRTALIGSGYSWKYVEEIVNFLKEKDSEINKKVLVESVELLNEIYVEPLKKKNF